MGRFGKDDGTAKFHGIKIGPMSQRSQEEIAGDDHPKRCQAVVGFVNKSRCKNDRMDGFSVCRKHQ